MGQTSRRYITFMAGVVCSALGISLITQAGLGTSPITSLAYVLTFLFPYSLGTFTLVVNICMFLLQMALMGRKFERVQYLQIPATLVFSLCIDGWLYLLQGLGAKSYEENIVILLLGCVALGLGIALEVIANVLILPGEGLVRAITMRTGIEFGRVKTCFDLGLVVSAVAVSVWCMGCVVGIREGTLIAALIVGSISRIFIAKFEHMELFAGTGKTMRE